MIRPAPRPPLFPYTTLFRSYQTHGQGQVAQCPVTQTFLAAGMPGGHIQDQGHAQGNQHQRQGKGICVQLGMHGADSPCPTPWAAQRRSSSSSVTDKTMLRVQRRKASPAQDVRRLAYNFYGTAPL